MSFSAAQHVGRVRYQIWDIICDTRSRLSNLTGYTSWAQIGLLLKKGQLESKSEQSIFSVLQFLLHWMSVMCLALFESPCRRGKRTWFHPSRASEGTHYLINVQSSKTYMILINSVSGAEEKIVSFMWMS